jgi:DNA-binding NarL/FixJ family response regulator
MSMDRARVLLADDHTIVAQGLGSLLKDDFELVGVVGDGHQLVEAARDLQPDVIVTDLSMPGMSGLEALQQLKQEGLDTRVIFLTMHADPQIATEALRAGASGFLLKHSAGEELITAIHEVLQGRIYLAPLITRDVLSVLAGPAATTTAPTPKLTPRQREVLQFIVQGRTMKEIAAALQLSRRTVETHKYEMMQVLGVETTAELIRYAIQFGLIDS